MGVGNVIYIGDIDLVQAITDNFQLPLPTPLY
jgi:hypothetical protein